jgi:hypothetical protein
MNRDIMKTMLSDGLIKLNVILTGKMAKRFYWNVLNGAIGGAIVYFSGINWLYAPLFIAMLNGITKELNTAYSNK